MKSISAITLACGLTLISANVMAESAFTVDQGQGQNMASAQTNSQKGQAFLAANKTQPGVVTLPDGLQYKVIKQGTGPIPAPSDTVTVNYAGKLINGTEFDSSYKRGQPASFPVTGVIAGWVEALQMMKVGSVWELYIPAPLAYGQAGAPPSIGPNETLIFKVELLGINNGAAT